MQKKISEFRSANGDVIFGFVGYEEWEDFVKIMKTIENVVCPEDVNYSGITSMKGYFIKDGLRVDVEYDSMFGNNITFSGESSDDNLLKVRNWVNLIFEKMSTECFAP